MRYYGVITSAQNVYYSVNVLFPEAIFVAASVPNMYIYSSRYYGKRATKAADPLQPAFPYSDYIKDQANLDVLCASFYNNCYRTNEIEYNDLVENGDKMYLKKGERVVYMGQDITAEKDVYVTLYGANHEHIDYLDELAVSLGLR